MAIEKLPTAKSPEKRLTSFGKELIPIPDSFKPVIINLIAHQKATKDTFNRISRTMKEDFNIDAAPEDIERLYQSRLGAVVKIRQQLKEGIQYNKERISHGAVEIISRRLKRASVDEEKMEMAKKALEAGLIDQETFNEKTRGLSLMSTNELLKIMIQFKNPETPPAGPVPTVIDKNGNAHSVPLTQVNQELADAIKRGDSIEIQRILYKATGTPIEAEVSEPAGEKTAPE